MKVPFRVIGADGKVDAEGFSTEELLEEIADKTGWDVFKYYESGAFEAKQRMIIKFPWSK